jgi:hypothetical protein
VLIVDVDSLAASTDTFEHRYNEVCDQLFGNLQLVYQATSKFFDGILADCQKICLKPAQVARQLPYCIQMIDLHHFICLYLRKMSKQLLFAD